MSGRTRPCPHCGTALPEDASFCPHCAQPVRPRREVVVPVHMWWKKVRLALWLAGLVLLAAGGLVLGAALYQAVTPDVYDAYGEVVYSTGSNSYHLYLTFQDNASGPQPEYTVQTEKYVAYDRASNLFITHVESGHNASPMFLQLVDTFYAQLIQPEDSPSPMTCSQPMYQAYDDDVALVTIVNLSGQSSPAELVWTFNMKNGDTIRLRQKLYLEQVETLDYYPEDYPMDTIEELQALVDQIAEEASPSAMVYLHLPPVHYEGGLIIRRRGISLYGSVDEKNMRTAFTGPVVIAPEQKPVSFIQNIDFRGSGSGVGLTLSAESRVENCFFSGWDTGLLVTGDDWCDPVGCWFEDNNTGFCFDSAGVYANYTRFECNTFRNNGTAVLLQQVPTDRTIDFIGSRFTGNGVNIDNPCSHPVDISYAIFE